jgi:hypothetical protein
MFRFGQTRESSTGPIRISAHKARGQHMHLLSMISKFPWISAGFGKYQAQIKSHDCAKENSNFEAPQNLKAAAYTCLCCLAAHAGEN